MCNMKQENGGNLLVTIEILDKLEEIKINLLSEFDEERLKENHQQYILMALDYINLATRNLKLLKIKFIND